MVVSLDRSDHEIIWLPDGDKAPDREKHMIQSPKLMQTFLWNPDEFQVVDAMPSQDIPKGEIFAVASYTRSTIFSSRSLLGMERGERKLVLHADNAGPHPAKVT
jgi:hypothetical protein